MKDRTLRLTCLSAALLAAASGANAQQAGDDGYLPLGTINLTGTGLPTQVMDSPSSVTVIDSQELENKAPSSIAKLLADVPGIRVTESGIERLRIRGESSQRVAILIDGQRISDHTTYGTPILVSPTDIERIEVVRGPSSVVSGNRAIGGVVNIITKRGADKPVEVTARGGYLGANDGYRGSAGIAGTVGDFDYRLSFSKSDLDDRDTPDGDLVPSGSDDREVRAFLGYRMDNHYVGLRAQDYDLSADVYTGDPAFNISLPKRDLRKYGAFYEGTDLTPWMSMLKLDYYYQTVDRQFRNDIEIPTGPFRMNIASTSDDEQTMRGFSATANLEFAPGHRTVIGFEYEDDRLISDKSTSTVSTAPFQPPTFSTLYSDASIRTISVFAQHESELSDRLTATVGMRYYDVDSDLDRYVIDGVAQPGLSNSDSRPLGALGVVYKLGEDAVLRANISQGYTYPSLSQLFLTSTGGGGTVLGNPRLDPETATNFEVGARLDRGNVVLDAAVFYTNADDYIASIGTGIPRQSQYRNVDSADSWGFEVAAEFDPGWWGGIRPYVNLSSVTREFSFENGFKTKDSGTPRWTGTAGLRGDWATASLSGSWDVYLRSESSAKQRDDTGVIVDETGGWTTFNLRSTLDLTENVALTLEAENLFDKSYRAMDQIEGAGRSFNVFVTATF